MRVHIAGFQTGPLVGKLVLYPLTVGCLFMAYLAFKALRIPNADHDMVVEFVMVACMFFWTDCAIRHYVQLMRIRHYEREETQ